MRKYAMLLLVLVMSATAWGSLSVNASIRTSKSGASVTVFGTAPAGFCVQKQWCREGNKFTLNVKVNGKDCSAAGSATIGPFTESLSNLSPGTYTVCVNVYCICGKCCKRGTGSRLVTRSSSTFTVGACGGSSSSSSSSATSSSSQSSSSSD